MSQTPRPFSTFLRRAHRLRLTWRFVEGAGGGLLVGCALAALALCLSWWRIVEALPPVIAILLVGAAAGVVAALRRSPTLLDTARLIEEQLAAPELLSTALTIHRDESFASVVVALADARVAGVSPASMPLRRLTGRAWTGVGLATAAVLVIAMMLTPLLPSQRVASAEELSRAAAVPDVQDDPSLSAMARDGEAASSPIEPARNDSHSALKGPSSSRGFESNRRTSASNSGGDSAGGGGASATEISMRGNQMEVTASNQTPGAASAGGIGSAGMTSRRGTGETGVVTASSRAAHAQPWQSSTWPADRDAALAALRNGTIDPRYRQLVKDYFQR